uniref:Claudin n=1 Tax=Eptatretus burgeri TaxID=7764 RepID=A0A8C4NE05_EPTBU
MVSSSCQIFACGICFIALVGFTITMGHPEWKITSRGSAVVVVTFMYQGLWVNCAGNSLGASQCRFHYTVIGLPAHLRASQAMMIVGMLLSLLGIALALMGLKCSQISGGDEKLKGRIVGVGGMMNILAGVAVISVISFYAWQTTIDYFGPDAGPKAAVTGQWSTIHNQESNALDQINCSWMHFQETCWILVEALQSICRIQGMGRFFIILTRRRRHKRYEYGVALYFGWASSVLAFVGGVMLSSSFTCCTPSMPRIPRPSYSAATKGPAKSSMKGYSRNAYV